MKYKVGDKVQIKSIDWYNENKDKYGSIYACNGFCFWKHMARHCGEIMKITIVKVDPEDSNKGYYFMENSEERWTDEMIEGLVEKSDDFEKMYMESEKRYEEEYSKGEYCHEQSFKWGFQEGCDYAHENEKLEIKLKNGYIFKDENGNVINATKIVLEKKKKEYPKTYDECCKIMQVARHTIWFDYDDVRSMSEEGDKYECHIENTLCTFRKLIICRDAYWKIAGEEMGLGKPWKPIDNSEVCYGIFTWAGEIQHDTTAKWRILTFPTAEMRDAFKENFDPDIEICKELL